MKIKPVYMLALLVLCTLAGCAGPSFSRDRISGTAPNIATWDDAGNVAAAYQGATPAHVESSAAGANIQQEGPGRVMTYSVVLPDGTQSVATIYDPADTELTGFRLSPDGSISLDTFGAKASTVQAVRNEAIINSLVSNQIITIENAETLRQVSGDAFEFAKVLGQILGPALVP